MSNLVLIGDPEEERFNWFRDLLKEEYGKEAIHCKTFGEIQSALTDPKNASIRLFFLSDDLPSSELPGAKIDPDENFSLLQRSLSAIGLGFVCIVTKELDPAFSQVIKSPYHVHLSSFPLTGDDRRQVVTELRTLGRLLPRLTKPSEIEWDRNDRILRRQIRALSDSNDIVDGEKQLVELIRKCIDCRNVEKVIIKQLGQGKSGASVFRLIIRFINNETKEFVLKLSNTFWKIESEVKGHLDAMEIHKDDYTKHIAVIVKPFLPLESVTLKLGANRDEKEHHEKVQKRRERIATSGQWFAIAYDFLGGSSLGEFIDIETALVGNPAELHNKTKTSRFLSNFVLDTPDKIIEFRLKILSATLDGLCDLWYSNKKFGDRKNLPVWKFEDAPDKEFIPLPPYQLTRRAKGWVQDFLDSQEAKIGERLFQNWNDHIEAVIKVVDDDDIIEFSNKEIPFTLSPVHGDLNSNNILLWLKFDSYPFLIDLPFYQRDGHSLQDFARLETEIKFALMDRQKESPENELIAFDYCVSQVPLWIEMENDLLKNDLQDDYLKDLNLSKIIEKECNWVSSGYKENAKLCYKLILLIRKKAFEVQQKELAEAPFAFADEYLPALLYHTIRSIGYPSLSLFKRLLATYSSGLIIDKLTAK